METEKVFDPVAMVELVVEVAPPYPAENAPVAP
jgi:hypothetical protein